ncbi:hypothetical protein LAT59_02115 [Candidatus Gracilibacteria bacterium]|nr:hypothetical protein [Candidatus Gracilibacteria bacterium]
MSIEELGGLESAEGGKQSAEISEKYKESAKKASAGIKKTQKDEKKAKKYDFLLASFLVELILKNKYDTLLEKLFPALDAGYGTNFLLGILSLIYIPISNEIRKTSGLSSIHFEFIIPTEITDFHPEKIPDQIRMRINDWIEDIHAVIRFESSALISERSVSLIIYDDTIRDFCKTTLLFFFEELHYTMSDSVATSYTEFILKELEKTLKETLKDFKREWTFEGLEI